MTSPLLIRGGRLVDPGSMTVTDGDVLVEGDRIAQIGPGLVTPEGASVIDAKDRIVLPGFVDTHRHTWQTGLRALAPDVTFAGYLEHVFGRIVPRFTPADVYAGTLAGVLDALDAGVTTLVDWSHIQLSPAHTDAALAALRDGGARTVFGFCYSGDGGPAELAAEARRVHGELAGDGLIGMAMAPFGPEIRDEAYAREEWRPALELGLPVTVHMGGHGAESAARGLAFLQRNGLLRPRTTFVHGNDYTDAQLELIAGNGGSISISPIVEAELGIGQAVTGRALAAGLPASLGADTVMSGPGDMFALMRAAYAMERARPDGAGMAFTTRDALRVATAEGAAVAGLGGVTGTLRSGAQADLVLLDATRIGMMPAHDAIGAVVLSADRSCVDTVLVAGRVVKRDGRLLHHDPPAVAGLLRESATRLAIESITPAA